MATIFLSPENVVQSQVNMMQSRKRRRLPRASQACEMCRGRKTRCDQQMPCSSCSYHGLECHYSASNAGRPKAKEKRAADNRDLTPVSEQAENQIPHGNTDLSAIHASARPKDCDIRPNDSGHASPETTPAPTVHIRGQDPIPNEDLESTLADDASTWLLPEEQSLKILEGELDGLGGLNAYTQGTEFYGGSSNLAFLSTLFTRARKRARICSDDPENNMQGGMSSPGHLKNNHLSLVDLMYNPDYPTAPPTEITDSKTPTLQRPISQGGSNATKITDSQAHDKHVLELEQYFIESYFANKHLIHPFLDEARFRARCLQMRTPGCSVTTEKKTTFPALYYSVVAVGAINAPINESLLLSRPCQNMPAKTTLQWAKYYYNLSNRALGNTFEVSTIETCQALFLLTILCQNALRPHSSYLYSGSCVRTAVAIGLTNKTYGDTMAVKEEARRTWWCIYSHEIEMCCSSGRVDSLKDPRYYSAPIPECSISEASDSNLDTSKYVIISVMVDLARIMQTASQDIYHNVSGLSVQQKSQISFNLDAALDNWKKALPKFLDFETFALDDAEWAFKQKLVLKFRYYNAQILIHRPFLVSLSASCDNTNFSRHVETCLDASRATIQIIHESLAHRPYLRTWWYCTTYTLYASMIILHVVLSDFAMVPGEELVGDIQKSLRIFSAMGKYVTVSKRCGELTQEILGVARSYLQDRRNRQTVGVNSTPHIILDNNEADIFGPSSIGTTDIWNDERLIELLSQEEPGSSRSHALANFLDLNILEGFVMENGCF